MSKLSIHDISGHDLGHVIAVNARTPEKMTAAVAYFIAMINALPCDECRGHALAFLKANPIENYTSSNLTLANFTRLLHNEATKNYNNKNKGESRQLFTWKQFELVWVPEAERGKVNFDEPAEKKISNYVNRAPNSSVSIRPVTANVSKPVPAAPVSPSSPAASVAKGGCSSCAAAAAKRKAAATAIQQQQQPKIETASPSRFIDTKSEVSKLGASWAMRTYNTGSRSVF